MKFFLFPVGLSLTTGAQDVTPPGDILEVIQTLLFNVVDNPVSALINANYIGILAWAIVLGIALRKASDSTKNVIESFSNAISIQIFVKRDIILSTFVLLRPLNTRNHFIFSRRFYFAF